MKTFSLAFFGDGPWASIALERLLSQRPHFDVRFVTPRYSKQDPELKRISERFNIPFLPVRDVNDAEFVASIEKEKLDIIVSMSFNQIFRSPVLNSTNQGIVNCHAGALPRYRGRNILNWVLINGEHEFGITVHHVDEGIDTGDIILQENFALGPDATYSDLLATAHRECPRLLINALDKLHDGTAERTPQLTLGNGFYCGMRREGDEWIDWNWPSRRIYDFVRGITAPAPGARFEIGKTEYICFTAKLLPDSPNFIGTEGEIIGIAPEGVVVKSGDNSIMLCECALGTEPQTRFKPTWKIGTRLTKRPWRIA